MAATEGEARSNAGREVECEIDNARADADPQALLQVVPGVLQPQHKQEQ